MKERKGNARQLHSLGLSKWSLSHSWNHHKHEHLYVQTKQKTVYKQCLRLRYLPDNRWNIAYHMDIRPFKKRSVFVLFWRQTWPWYIVVIANENWIRSISHTCPQPYIQITMVSQDPKYDISQPCHNQLFPRIQLYTCIHAHTHNHPPPLFIPTPPWHTCKRLPKGKPVPLCDNK